MDVEATHVQRQLIHNGHCQKSKCCNERKPYEPTYYRPDRGATIVSALSCRQFCHYLRIGAMFPHGDIRMTASARGRGEHVVRAIVIERLIKYGSD